MTSLGKSNSEIINEFLDMMSKGKNILLSDIDEAISTRSVIDTIASPDAVTIFYSGEPEELINTIAKDGSKIRMIRRTEAFEFVGDKKLQKIVEYAVQCENPTWTEKQVEKEVGRLFYEASEYTSSGDLIKKGEGYWTEISRRFASDTKGDAYSLCTNASSTRIYAADELPTWLDVADDSAKMGGYTKAELLAMNKADRFKAIQDWTINDMNSTRVFFDTNGNKIGQTFADSSLSSRVSDVVPNDYLFETSLKETKTFLSESDLKVKYSFLDNLPDNVKSTAKSKFTIYEYLESIGADESIIQKLGIKSDAKMRTLYSDYDKLNIEQQSLYKYIDYTVTQHKSINELTDAFDFTSGYYNKKFDDIILYIDDDGKLIQSSLTNLGETIDSSAKYSANIKELKEFGEIKDVDLARRIGDEFDGMTTAEKWQMREYITYHTMIEDILIDPMNPVAQAA